MFWQNDIMRKVQYIKLKGTIERKRTIARAMVHKMETGPPLNQFNNNPIQYINHKLNASIVLEENAILDLEEEVVLLCTIYSTIAIDREYIVHCLILEICCSQVSTYVRIVYMLEYIKSSISIL